MSLLPKITGKCKLIKGCKGIEKYFYAYIRCNIFIKDKKLIHPLIVPSPILIKVIYHLMDILMI